MLGEDNSDPIKVHPELNSASTPRPCVRALATGKFQHANTPIESSPTKNTAWCHWSDRKLSRQLR